jgi:hypothetical protein
MEAYLDEHVDGVSFTKGEFLVGRGLVIMQRLCECVCGGTCVCGRACVIDVSGYGHAQRAVKCVPWRGPRCPGERRRPSTPRAQASAHFCAREEVKRFKFPRKKTRELWGVGSAVLYRFLALSRWSRSPELSGEWRRDDGLGDGLRDG